MLDPTNPVGVQFVPASSTHPPLRIFYPINVPDHPSRIPPQRDVGWFDETGVVNYLEGYFDAFGILQGDSWTSRWIVKPWLLLISYMLPMKWLRLPGVFRDSPPRSPGQYPLVIFSHGLTGTGQENAALCASWAKEGMVVVGVWHTDGSSSHVPLADGTKRYYESPPPITQYDAHFRPRQVQKRAEELFQARQFMLDTSDKSAMPLLQQIRSVIDPNRVAVAGYSYGAATVALTVAQMTSHSHESSIVSQQLPFQAAIFLDGWFHIDIQESAGIEFEFPVQAFEYVQNNGSWPIPSLFLNSEQFHGYHKLFDATQKLATAAGTQPIVLSGTGHQNFCDVIFWFPTSLLQQLMMGAIGQVDPLKAYQEVVERSTDFLKQHLQQDRPAMPTQQ